MNTSEFTRGFAARYGYTITKSQEFTDSLFAYIRELMARGETVSIRSFGTFSTRRREGRSGRNPLTGEPVEIPAKTAPAFQFSASVKRSLAEQ